jgi:pyruvate,water dikinase
MELSLQLSANPRLYEVVRDGMQTPADGSSTVWAELESRVRQVEGGDRLLNDFHTLLDQFMDITFSGQRLVQQPAELLHTVVELASKEDGRQQVDRSQVDNAASCLEQRLLDAVGPSRHQEAREVIRLGRLSWRLRDDDNILVSQLESQLLRALQEGASRLKQAGRLNGETAIDNNAVDPILRALRTGGDEIVCIRAVDIDDGGDRSSDAAVTPRQLVGQPAAPGFCTGKVRIVRKAHDLGLFRAGEVLVCDAIQPMMTHVVPLAAAVVERRGGMLIHGAIIARELGIPCVNGVENVVDLVFDGQRVSVDGHLGLVTLGEAELDLELA